jgi:hypothetical protein
MASSRSGTSSLRVHSVFSERMNRSMNARLPYWPTAPKRGRIRWRRHQRGIGIVVLTNGGSASSDLPDRVAAGLYDHLLGRSDTQTRLDERIAELETLRQKAIAAITTDRAKRAARSQVLPRPRADYAGRYVSPTLGTLEVALVDGHLEAVMGAARSAVEVYNAEKNQLRAELFGRGSVLTVDFSAASQEANAVQLLDATFTRPRN